MYSRVHSHAYYLCYSPFIRLLAVAVFQGALIHKTKIIEKTPSKLFTSFKIISSMVHKNKYRMH